MLAAANVFVATNVLSRQAYFCRDKNKLVATKIILAAMIGKREKTKANQSRQQARKELVY